MSRRQSSALPFRLDAQRREVIERAGRAVLARNPLRINQRHRAGHVGTRFVHVGKAARRQRRVDAEHERLTTLSSVWRCCRKRQVRLRSGAARSTQ